MPDAHRWWVIDTSSLLRVREIFGRRDEGKMFARFTALAEKGLLFFPPEVYHELERGSPDAVLNWAKRVRDQAEQAADLQTVKEVLAVASDLLDADNPAEQADPYVIALAIDVRGLGFDVTVVTDDFRDKPSKISLATAAGMLGLPSVPLTGFARSIPILR